MPTARTEIDRLQIEVTFFENHWEPGLRLLALAVLDRAKRDAVRESAGFHRSDYNQTFESPLPLAWLDSHACADWCEAAQLNPGAYRRAVRRACEQAIRKRVA